MPNSTEKAKLKALLTEDVRFLMRRIRQHKGEARLVGGCVRDALLPHSEKSDRDLATTLPPQTVFALFNKPPTRCIATGLAHGTVTVLLNNTPYEITTLRSDQHCDGRHAEVAFTTNWQQDAQRRDFTFNALYLDEQNRLYDYFGGVTDLKNGRLRFVGEPGERIQEDFLRILRVFRFYQRFCQTPLSLEIQDACQQHSASLQKLSGERIQSEMLKILSAKPPFSETLKHMHKIGILKHILVDEMPRVVTGSADGFLRYDQYCHFVTDPWYRLGWLLHEVAPESRITQTITKRWRLSRKHAALLHSIQNCRLRDFGEGTFLPLSKTVLAAMEIVDLFTYPEKYLAQYDQSFLEKHLVPLIHFEYGIHQEALHLRLSSAQKPLFPLTGYDFLERGFTGKALGNKQKMLQQFWQDTGCRYSKNELLHKLVSRESSTPPSRDWLNSQSIDENHLPLLLMLGALWQKHQRLLSPRDLIVAAQQYAHTLQHSDKLHPLFQTELSLVDIERAILSPPLAKQ